MTAYLVIGAALFTMSYSCIPVERSFSPIPRTVVTYRACPDMMRTGMDSIQAHRQPVSALVAPGPVVTSTQAGRLFTRA